MKKVLLVFLMFLLAAFCAAQEKKSVDKNIPDLNGTWVLDKKKSAREPGVWAIVRAEITLVILQSEPEIKIKRATRYADGKVEVENILYYTDGRRMSVRGKNDEKNYRTVEWKKGMLVKRDKYRIEMGEGADWFIKNSGRTAIELKSKQEWKFSDDGNTLTLIETGGNMPNIPTLDTFTLVFRRVR
ncbi:MAG: hypothetical protein ABWZ66_09600 [Pyrinomonadaceae bacterium]